MLTQVTSGGVVASTKTQVAASLNVIGGTVIYTVPAGRKFDGYLVGAPGAAAYATINDQAVYCSGSSTAPATTGIPVSLVAGTKVKGTATNGTLVGVESDA